MDISRILEGEHLDENGNPYNSRILKMQSEIAAIADIGRYAYRVQLLANAPDLSVPKLRQLTGGYPADIIDNDRTYLDLVLPVITGTYFRQRDIQIAIDLSNKNAGTKISYEVRTQHYDCEITVVFAPIIEIARVMQRYKNSILRFNPRSYLELQGHVVNEAIRETVVATSTNEFALFNNGITMLSDESYINERIGQRNKAQLTLKNPQIINGGQTAYTLSRILEESTGPDKEAAFRGKEVLLKVITLIEDPARTDTANYRVDLIDQISKATNQQTPVINADKSSNNQDHLTIQRIIFDRYGLLYERKRGEFADGLYRGYISSDLVIERNLYFRLYFAVVGDFDLAVQKRLFLKVKDPCRTIQDFGILDRLYFSFLCYKRLAMDSSFKPHMGRDRAFYTKLHALSLRIPQSIGDFPGAADAAISNLDRDWASFMRVASSRRKGFWQKKIGKKSGLESMHFDRHRWISSGAFVKDADALFGFEKTALEAQKLQNEPASTSMLDSTSAIPMRADASASPCDARSNRPPLGES